MKNSFASVKAMQITVALETQKFLTILKPFKSQSKKMYAWLFLP